MRTRSRFLLQTSIYVASTFSQRAIPFLLLPVLTMYLAPAEYGTVAVFQAVLAITLPFLGTSLPLALSKEYHRIDQLEFGRLVSAVAVLACSAAAIVAVILACSITLTDSLFGIPIVWLIIAVIVAPLTVLGRASLTLLRFQNKPSLFAAIEIFGVLVNIGISLALVVAVGMGWRGRIIGILAGPMVVGLVGTSILFRKGLVHRGFQSKHLKGLLALTIPASLHYVSSAFMTGIDRLFIDTMVSKDAVGIYAVGFSFAMIVYMLLQSFHQAWGPRMFKNLNDPSAGSFTRLVRQTYAYDAATILLALIVTAAAHLLIPFMIAEHYHACTQYVIWIALAFAVNGMYSMRTYYIIHTDKTGFLGFLAFAVVGINVVANTLLIPLNGPVGAAQATLIAYTVRFIAVWWYAHRVHPMPWRLRRTYIPPVIANPVD